MAVMTPDLFTQPYPHSPGFAKHSATSRLAAETVARPLSMRQLVMEELSWGDHTDHELASILKLPLCRIQPRRSELYKLGKVVDSGLTRLTPYGKQATVWRLA
jgi:hypothetical protein